MGLAQSLGLDLLVMADNDPRTVTHRPRLTADTFADGYEVAGVLREDLSSGVRPEGGVGLATRRAVFWLLPSRLTATPRLHDWLDEPDGGQWQVDAADLLAEGTLWKLTCTGRV